MVIAAIDLGTNTFDLLVGYSSDKELKILYHEKRWVGLGVDLYPEFNLSDEGISKAIECLSNYKVIGTSFGVEAYFCLGTSALRDARNADTFIDRVKLRLDLDVRVIDGKEEAATVFKAINYLNDRCSNGIIMDIGGGSTEFISFQQGEITDVYSYDIGVTRILTTFDLPNSLSSENITLLKDFFNKKCDFVNVRQPMLIGSSGAFETFYRLLNSAELPRHQLVNLSLNQLIPLLDKLVCSSENERMEMDHVPAFRKKYLHIAALQVQWVIETFGIHEVWVTSAGLCEGVMIQYLTLNER